MFVGLFFFFFGGGNPFFVVVDTTISPSTLSLCCRARTRRALPSSSPSDPYLRIRPSASPAGSGPVNAGPYDDGFVSPLDLRRKAKLRTLAHGLVMDTVEAALSQCVPQKETQGTRGTESTGRRPAVAVVVKSAKSAKPTPGFGLAVVVEGAAAPPSGRAAEAPRAAMDSPLSARMWPSPEESMPRSFWKVPATLGQRGGLPGPGTRVHPPNSPATGAAIAPPTAAAAAAAAVLGSARNDGVRSPSLLGSPRPPGSVVYRRREIRRERDLAMNDADERMSWSSFDSLDVRVDDQVGGNES